MKFKHKFTAIIACYNEQANIQTIIKEVIKCDQISEVIVINDGSSDRTSIKIQDLKSLKKLRIIELLRNEGKGYALSTGINFANNQHLLFIDADLKNLRVSHLLELMRPIDNNEADMVLGQPTKNPANYFWNPFKKLSGQRAMKLDDISPLKDKLRVARFGAETLINLYYKKNKMKTKTIPLRGLYHPIKFQKRPFNKALKEYFCAFKEIVFSVFRNRKFLLAKIKT
jgi:glycosyltransferase involved in cell wall biosynthesis